MLPEKKDILNFLLKTKQTKESSLGEYDQLQNTNGHYINM